VIKKGFLGKECVDKVMKGVRKLPGPGNRQLARMSRLFAVQNGQSWLLLNVQADGSWNSERNLSGIRSTSRALSALGDQAPVESVLWLESRVPSTLEEVAAAALAV